MQEESLIRVYFLGSGDEGIPVLRRLLDAPGIDVVGIGTQPDRPAGRKRALRPTPIAEFAESAGRGVDKPISVNTEAFLDTLRQKAPDMIVVMSFGQILKSALLRLPPYGCLNVHLSLLPRHRGAAPVAAAILAGDTEAGVSFMQMDAGLDTGPVYRRIAIPLSGNETAPELEVRLKNLGAEHIVAVIQGVVSGEIKPAPQPEEGATYTRKIKKEEARIQWQRPAQEIERAVRAYLPWPRAWFLIRQHSRVRRIQVTRADVAPLVAPFPPGKRVTNSPPEELIIACAQDALRILRLIPEGKREMDAAEFLRGVREFEILAADA